MESYKRHERYSLDSKLLCKHGKIENDRTITPSYCRSFIVLWSLTGKLYSVKEVECKESFVVTEWKYGTHTPTRPFVTGSLSKWNKRAQYSVDPVFPVKLRGEEASVLPRESTFIRGEKNKYDDHFRSLYSLLTYFHVSRQWYEDIKGDLTSVSLIIRGG